MYSSPWAIVHLVKQTRRLRDSTCWVESHQPEHCQDEQREVIGDQLVHLLMNFLPLQLCTKPKFLRSRTIAVLASWSLLKKRQWEFSSGLGVKEKPKTCPSSWLRETLLQQPSILVTGCEF